MQSSSVLQGQIPDLALELSFPVFPCAAGSRSDLLVVKEALHPVPALINAVQTDRDCLSVLILVFSLLLKPNSPVSFFSLFFPV